MKSDDEFTIDRLREDAITWYDPENDEGLGEEDEVRPGPGIKFLSVHSPHLSASDAEVMWRMLEGRFE